MPSNGLFCKSFRGDLERLKILVHSVERHLIGELPFVIACPANDVGIIRKALPEWIEVLDESSFTRFDVNDRMGVWREQQLVKMMFGVTGRFDHFYVVDSDSYFLRSFSESDLFAVAPAIELTASAHRYLFHAGDQLLVDLALGTRAKEPSLQPESFAFRDVNYFSIRRDLIRSRGHAARRPADVEHLVGDAFGHLSSIRINFLPTPIPWTSEVLQDMWVSTQADNLSFSDLLRYAPWEAIWYGYWALQRFSGRVVLREPDFLHFSSDTEIFAARAMGVSESTLCINFLGVTLAARHQDEIRFDNVGM